MQSKRLYNVPFIWVLITAVLLTLPQFINRNVVVGVDGMFHMNRFYDAMQQIRHMNFSTFQMNYGFEQSGRIVNALYGPLFSYAAGFILLITRTWFRFQLVMGLAVEIIAGWGAYRLAIATGARRFWATAVALIYMVSGIVPVWLSDQQFSAWGAAIVPYVLVYGVLMARDGRVRILPLALSMAILMQTHLLSTVMTAGTLVVLAVYAGIHHGRWGRLCARVGVAAITCLLLTANVWGGLLTVYRHNQVIAPFGPVASSTNATTATTGAFKAGTAADLGLILSIILLAQIAAVVLNRQISSLNRWLTLDGAFFLLLSSNLLPWTKIIAHWPALVTYLQFPSRFRVVAVPLLLAGAALSLTELAVDTAVPRWRVIPAVAIAMLTWQTMGTTMTLGDTWQSPTVIPNPTGVVYRKVTDMTQVKSALSSRNPVDALRVIGKASADYLPLPGKYAASVHAEAAYPRYQQLKVPITPITADKTGGGPVSGYVDEQLAQAAQTSTDTTYQREIVLNQMKVTKTARRGGVLELSWHADKTGKVRLPVVAYAQTQATLNGHSIPQNTLLASRNKIGVIQVKQRKGTNVLTLRFKSGMLMHTLLLVTGISWVLVLALLIFRRLSKLQLNRQGQHALA